MFDVRQAIDDAALTICEVARRPDDKPCHQCRSVARGIVLAFLDGMPAVRWITPLELRLRVMTEGADA
jgi:hypothetical protein